MVHSDFKVLICGSGDAAQAAAALFAARYKKTVAMSLTSAAVRDWKQALGEDDFELTMPGGSLIKAKPAEITDEPSAAKDADLVLLVASPLEHGTYLEALAPHMAPGTTVVAMPLRPDAEELFQTSLGSKAAAMVFCGYGALPWTTRVTEWGRKATIVGARDQILAAVVPQTAAPAALQTLQGLKILGVTNVKAESSVRSVFLRSLTYLFHPGITFGRWCPASWDGTPVKSAPLFYHGLDGHTESVLRQLGDEMRAICTRIGELSPDSDLADVPDIKQYLISAFESSISDTSTLQSCFETNSAFETIEHVCKEAEGGVVPDLELADLREHVLIGLAFVKGLAQIVEVTTEQLDEVLQWAQQHLGLEILVDGKLAGRDLQKTCAPQAMGIMTRSALFEPAMTAGSDSSQGLPFGRRRPSRPTPSSKGDRAGVASTELASIRVVRHVPATGRECFYGWAIVSFCALCMICKGPGGSFLMALSAASIREDLGITNVEFGLLFMVSAFVAGPLQPKLGAWADRYGGRVCIPAAQALFALALYLCSILQAVQSKWYLYAQVGLVMFFMRSLATGALDIFPHACVQQWFEQRLGRALSSMNLLEFLGLAFIVPVMDMVASERSWRVACLDVGLCNLCLVPLSLTFLRKSPDILGMQPDGLIPRVEKLDPNALEAAEEMVASETAAASFSPRSQSFQIVWTCAFFYGLILCGTEMYMHEILDHSFYLTSGKPTPVHGTEASYIFMPHMLACAGTQLLVGELIDKFGKAYKRLPEVLLCVGVFLLALTNLALVVIDTPQDAILLGMGRGLSNGIYEILLVSGLIFPALGVPRSKTGEALGYNQMAVLVGTGVGPLAFALYSHYFGNYWGVLLLTSVLAFALGLCLTLRLVKKSR
jgi:MFS family permease